MQAPIDPTERLEGYLRQDPDNEALRVQVFESALRHRQWDRAFAHLEAGSAQGTDPWGWRLRAAHLHMARRQFDEAAAVLDDLRRDPRAPAALVVAATIDAAQVALRQDRAEQGMALLAPIMEAQAHPPTDPVTQVLWLRLLHRSAPLDVSLRWAETTAGAGQLSTPAAGVASLIALDAGDFAAGRRYADAALGQPGAPIEAFVARATLALGDQDPAAALRCVEPAIAHHPDDGRARSVKAFALMQAGHFGSARQEFELAVDRMPGHIGTWHGLGWVCLLQKDLSGAHRAFAAALALDRNFAESHGALASVLALEGKPEKARSAIDRALRLDRSCLSAHYAQSVLDGTAGDPQRLRQLAQALLADKASGIPLGLPH